MNLAEVLQVIDQIVHLLTSHGHPNEAEWLVTEAAVLRDSKLSDTEIQEALHRLHHIVPGMGGLMDLPLTGSSREEEAHARQALDRLSDQLYKLTP